MTFLVSFWVIGAIVNIALDAWMNGEITPMSIAIMCLCGIAWPVLLLLAVVAKMPWGKPIWKRK